MTASRTDVDAAKCRYQHARAEWLAGRLSRAAYMAAKRAYLAANLAYQTARTEEDA